MTLIFMLFLFACAAVGVPEAEVVVVLSTDTAEAPQVESEDAEADAQPTAAPAPAPRALAPAPAIPTPDPVLDAAPKSAPLTQADMAELIALAELAGAEASENWIRSEGPRTPGPLGTTRAEFLDWIKTIAVSVGVGIGTAVVFWLRRWFAPLTKWLSSQPLLEEIARNENNLTTQLKEQQAVSSELRKELERVEAAKLAASPLRARKDNPGPSSPPGVRDFSRIGLEMLHGPDDD